MFDIKKVQKGLKACSTADCNHCPYAGTSTESKSCESVLMRDAYKLLKEGCKVVICKDCKWFEPNNAEEGDYSGMCRNDSSPCQNQWTDAFWFCGDGKMEG